MRDYTFLRLSGGRLVRTDVYEFFDDVCAIGLARALPDRVDCEIWDGDRLVDRVRRAERPSAVF
jgi:hypothetical protein